MPRNGKRCWTPPKEGKRGRLSSPTAIMSSFPPSRSRRLRRDFPAEVRNEEKRGDALCGLRPFGRREDHLVQSAYRLNRGSQAFDLLYHPETAARRDRW